MTKEEAIKDIQDNILPVVGGKSLVMAISALRQPEIVTCEECKYWDTSWETVYGLHYCPMIDMATKKNFFCKYGAEKRGEVDETD